MRNQVEMAKRIGIRAHTIHSGNREEWDQTEADLANPGNKTWQSMLVPPTP